MENITEGKDMEEVRKNLEEIEKKFRQEMEQIIEEGVKWIDSQLEYHRAEINRGRRLH